jgi:hypothetical protein
LTHDSKRDSRPQIARGRFDAWVIVQGAAFFFMPWEIVLVLREVEGRTMFMQPQ